MWNISDNIQDKKSPKFKMIQMLNFNIPVKAAITRALAHRRRPSESTAPVTLWENVIRVLRDDNFGHTKDKLQNLFSRDT